MRIAIVEDDDFYAKYLQHILELIPEYSVQHFKNGNDFFKQDISSFDTITLDYSLPDITCESVIARLKSQKNTGNVVVVSAQEDVSTAVQLLRIGAYDYVVKNEDTKERILNTLRNLSEKQSLEKEIENLNSEVRSKYDFRQIIKGSSSEMEPIFSILQKAVKSNITVSISGETGTGKELVAKAIHYNSTFSKKPLVTVNMAAIPSELIESELFGHEKGAFTGADKVRIGKFEEANGGTIFLDEVAELGMPLQAKLLRVLQEKEVVKVGGNKPISLNMRIIVASHKDLLEEVNSGNFREDLYYRLMGLPIHLPPLRERTNDIIFLAKYFSDLFSRENGLPVKSISKMARTKLLNHFWPGNIRELKAVIELAVVMSDNQIIDASDITLNSSSSTPHILLEQKTLKEYTNAIIEHHLKKNSGNVVRVAEKLDVGKSTVYRMIKKGEIKL